MKRPVTIRYIAKQAGVSHATVSLALRGSPQVSEKRRQEIRKLADQLGYRPDPALNALNFYRNGEARRSDIGTLGFVHNWPTDHFGDNNPLYFEFYLGAKELSESLGYRLEEFSLAKKGVTPKRVQDILISRGIQGVLIPPMQHPGDTIRWDWSKFSCVALGLTMRKPAIHRVANHHFHAMRQCAQKLLEAGHQRIGLVIEEEQNNRTSSAYLGAFLTHTSHLKTSSSSVYLVKGAPERELDEIVSWLKSNRFDGLILLGWSYIQALLDRGIRIPQDLSIVAPYDIGFTGKEQRSGGSFDYGSVSHVEENVRGIGATAANTLARMLHQFEKGLPNLPQTILIKGIWREGKTIRDRRDAKKRKAKGSKTAKAKR